MPPNKGGNSKKEAGRARKADAEVSSGAGGAAVHGVVVWAYLVSLTRRRRPSRRQPTRSRRPRRPTSGRLVVSCTHLYPAAPPLTRLQPRGRPRASSRRQRRPNSPRRRRSGTRSSLQRRRLRRPRRLPRRRATRRRRRARLPRATAVSRPPSRRTTRSACAATRSAPCPSCLLSALTRCSRRSSWRMPRRTQTPSVPRWVADDAGRGGEVRQAGMGRHVIVVLCPSLAPLAHTITHPPPGQPDRAPPRTPLQGRLQGVRRSRDAQAQGGCKWGLIARCQLAR